MVEDGWYLNYRVTLKMIDSAQKFEEHFPRASWQMACALT